MGHPGAALLGSYDYRRVGLSILVPILASYVALDLAVCLTAARESDS
jgi:NO-binding membrane sensor protein with MHYT domain